MPHADSPPTVTGSAAFAPMSQPLRAARRARTYDRRVSQDTP